MHSNMMHVRKSYLLVLALLACAVHAQQGAITAQSALKDRRVPYYVLPGCDYMLDANGRCDTSDFPAPAVGCCPMGFECAPQIPAPGEEQVSRCVAGRPTYRLRPDCARRALANRDCSEDSCCPDGFDCVENPSGKGSKCMWTGRPISPPADYVTSIKQMTDRGRAAVKAKQARNSTTMQKARAAAAAVDEAAPDSGNGGRRRLRQSSCAAGFLCPATTLVQDGQTSCNAGGPRWQAPSCKCYDRPSDAAMAAAPPALDVAANGQWIVKSTGSLASIQGINWFGFNNGQGMVDGLWAGYQNATIGDFPTVLKRIKLLGFNGLRLPFTFSDLDKAPPTSLYVTGVKVDTFQQFRRSLTPTYTTPNAGTDVTATYLSLNSCGFDSNPTETTQGSMSLSNKHVPGRQDATTWNRFFWLIQYAVGQGFYVTIDFHFEQSGLQNSPAQFASEWRRLWTDFVSLPTYVSKLQGAVFVELANEWDKFGCRWDTAGGRSCAASYRASIEAAAAAVLDASASAGVAAPLMLINGVGQTAYGFNWGDGFITDASKISQFRLSDPRGFFSADNAATRNYKIVLAPHTYGPTVTGQTVAQTSGSTLWERLHASWGSKCPAADLNAAEIQQQYAVAITEFGSDCDIYDGLSSRACLNKDATFLQDFAAYLSNSAAIPSQFSKNRNTVWYWWSWNANSGDTGGIVSGSKPGAWYPIKWYKVRYLEGLGLCPWYRGTCA